MDKPQEGHSSSPVVTETHTLWVEMWEETNNDPVGYVILDLKAMPELQRADPGARQMHIQITWTGQDQWDRMARKQQSDFTTPRKH